MSEKKIDSFYPPIADATISNEVEEADKKRPRSLDSTSSSPLSKKTIFECEIPDEAPLWFTKLTAAMEKISEKCDSFTSKFDNFTRVIESRVSDFTSEINSKIQTMEKSIDFVTKEFDHQKKTNAILESKIAKLNDELKASKAASIDAADALEQYSRRNCVLLHGIPEQKNEDTDDLFIKTVQKHLGVAVKVRDIDRSHRVGAVRASGGGRPIIVKFARYNVRAKVFRVKKKFKNSKFMLTESLTKKRVALLNEARDTYGKHNVWSWDGEILASIDGKISNVRNL